MRTFVGVDCYLTIEKSAEGVLKERGSRFLGYAFPIGSIGEVKMHVDRLKNEHHAARHHCYAYRIGVSGDEFRANDDGEPSGSAGRPILGQIDSRGLSDVLVVVVRYFGGTLLGVPGLIAAYKGAAGQALDAAQVQERVIQTNIAIQVGYGDMDRVLRTVRAAGVEIIEMVDQQGQGVCLKVQIRASQADGLQKRLEELRIEQMKITI